MIVLWAYGLIDDWTVWAAAQILNVFDIFTKGISLAFCGRGLGSAGIP